MSVVPPKRLLVTGGRGRLASLIAEHHRTANREVSLYSRDAGNGFNALEDLARPGALTSGDTLLHLAWSTLPATSEQSAGSEEQHDFPLLTRLLEACVRSGAHFVFFSSGGTVYGNAPGRPNRETDDRQPIGSYGRAKVAAEKLIEQAVSRHGLACTVLRISNPYGYPVPSGRAQGVIAHAVRCAVEGQPLTLWGDGQAQKDFLHYTDFLAALDIVVRERLAGVFNLSRGESHSVRQIIELVEKHTGRSVTTRETPAPAWDVRDSRLDNTRLIRATGWQPRITLDEGIRRFAGDFKPR